MKIIIWVLLVIAIAQFLAGDRRESIQTVQTVLLIAILGEVKERDK